MAEGDNRRNISMSISVKSADAKPKLLAATSAFADDSDDESGSQKKLTASEMFNLKYSSNKAKNIVEKTAAEDPSIFEYDAVYDSFQRTRGHTKEQKEADKERKPKYVDALMKAHKRRELQRLVHDEHTYRVEREKEAGQFDDQETFITESYKKKIAERERFRAEIEREDALDEIQDVKNQQMWQQAFHRKMLDNASVPADTSEDESSSNKKAIVTKTETEDREYSTDNKPKRNSEKTDNRFISENKKRSSPQTHRDSKQQHREVDKERTRRRESSPIGASRQRKVSPETAARMARMERIREIVAKRNGPNEIEAARQRFFERRAAGEVLLPI